MSGSDGTFGDTPPEVKCETLVLETYLGSPKASVISQLKPQDVLAVELQQIQSLYVVVATFDGAIAGGLASPRAARLRECMLLGFKFRAIVIEISEGQVKVRVSSIPKAHS